jgi:hypothetical protein
MTFRRALRRLTALTRKRALDGELDNEILAHLELVEREALARGLSPEDARRTARLSFGNRTNEGRASRQPQLSLDRNAVEGPSLRTRLGASRARL